MSAGLLVEVGAARRGQPLAVRLHAEQGVGSSTEVRLVLVEQAVGFEVHRREIARALGPPLAGGHGATVELPVPTDVVPAFRGQWVATELVVEVGGPPGIVLRVQLVP